MPTKIRVQSEKVNKRGYTYPSRGISPGSQADVHESYFRGADNQKIETLLTDIVTRHERIEEKIDETVYPPESAIRPEYIRKVKKIQSGLSKGKAKTYRSMDEFIQSLRK
jgi:hypothetical protein